MRQRPLLMATAYLAILSGVAPAQQTLRLDHVVVSHTRISEEYARAIGRTVAAGRAVASETVDPKGRTRLFTDGKDRIFFTVHGTGPSTITIG